MSQYSLVLGDSTIRDVDESRLLDTKVISKAGASVNDINSVVDRLPDKYPKITLVVGGNECENSADKTPEDITNSLGSLIRSAKTKADKIVVSSICPRLSKKETQEKIDAVNAGLNVVCSDITDVAFIDSTPTFRLGDGSINDGYLLPDGVHLTGNGVNKLAQKLELPVANSMEGVVRTKTDHRQHRSGDVTTRNTHGDRQRCYFCFERGHVKGNCYQGREVKCHNCGKLGHKSKFCVDA